MSAILFKIQNKEIPPIAFIEAFGKKMCLTLRTFQKAQEEPMQKRNSWSHLENLFQGNSTSPLRLMKPSLLSKQQLQANLYLMPLFLILKMPPDPDSYASLLYRNHSYRIFSYTTEASYQQRPRNNCLTKQPGAKKQSWKMFPLMLSSKLLNTCIEKKWAITPSQGPLKCLSKWRFLQFLLLAV